MDDKQKALDYFKPPFKYEPMGQTIYCEGANGNQMALQVRGWGNLIGLGANMLPLDVAEKVQDDFGQWVVDAMNAALTSGWRTDMENAPKDKDILLYNDRGAAVAFWCPEDNWWITQDHKHQDRPLRGSEPTHWREITPPTADTPMMKDGAA